MNLIVSDLNMPNMNGIELLRKLRGDGRFGSLPFILLTTMAEWGSVLTAVEQGASGYLIKPYDMKTLREKIAPYLGSVQ